MGWKSKFILIRKYSLLFMSILIHFFQYSAKVCLIPPEMFFWKLSYQNLVLSNMPEETQLLRFVWQPGASCFTLFSRIPSADAQSCSIYVLQSRGEMFCLCHLPSFVCRAVRKYLRRKEGKQLFFIIELHLLPSELEFMLSVDFVSWGCSKDIIGWNGLNRCDGP